MFWNCYELVIFLKNLYKSSNVNVIKFLLQISIGLTAIVSDQVSKRWKKKKPRTNNPTNSDGTEDDEDAEEEEDDSQ